MKVLHISKYYHPFRGGIEKVIQELSEGTQQSGHQVRVLSSGVSGKLIEEVINGVEVVRLPRMGILYSQPLVLSLFWHLKKHLQWADIVHMHTPNPLAELAYVLLADDSKPLITTYHCDVIRQRRLMTFYRPVAQALLARSKTVVVSTPNHLKYSQPLQPHLDRCQVVPFGIQARFAKRSMAVNERLKEIKDRYGDYFLFVGRLVPYKGVDILMQAIKATKHKVICIGKGPRWEIWHEMARDLGVKDQIEFLGQVDDDEEFAAYFHGCHSVVLPSVDESEAFGIVLIEAMACGKPVITTKLESGVSWVNQANVTGLEVAPREWEPLAQAMSIMSNEHQLRMQLGEQAKQRFNDTFQLAGMIQGYEKIYLEALGKTQKPATQFQKTYNHDRALS